MDIKQIWARASEKYPPFNINVMIVDAAVAAGDAHTTRTARRTANHHAQMMHRVIGDWTWAGANQAQGR